MNKIWIVIGVIVVWLGVLTAFGLGEKQTQEKIYKAFERYLRDQMTFNEKVMDRLTENDP